MDDVYIIMASIKRRGEYTRTAFIEALSEVLIPVTMTSLTNLSMFAVMLVSDLPLCTILSKLVATVSLPCIYRLYFVFRPIAISISNDVLLVEWMFSFVQ